MLGEARSLSRATAEFRADFFLARIELGLRPRGGETGTGGTARGLRDFGLGIYFGRKWLGMGAVNVIDPR